MKSNIRKSLGFIALAVTVACWIGAPILPFLEIPDKVLYTTVVVITGELFFVVTVALLG
ncbi:MAG: transporter suffix domain-containing protein [Bacteroidetes bacterium]|nr:transporter suffix domain-containing protein [Bacteroidota bacterium]